MLIPFFSNADMNHYKPKLGSSIIYIPRFSLVFGFTEFLLIKHLIHWTYRIFSYFKLHLKISINSKYIIFTSKIGVKPLILSITKKNQFYEVCSYPVFA